MDKNKIADFLVGVIFAIASVLTALIGFASLTGCTSYKGGKVVDGQNIEIGMTIPGTQWTINFLAYTSGLKVAGNDQTIVTVTNCVCESNNYFGIVHTWRQTQMSAKVEPTAREGDADGPPGDDQP